MNQPVVIDPQPDQALDLQRKRLALDAGWLGSVFGMGPQAPINITGLVVILLILGGLAAMYTKTEMSAAEYWKIAGPIITGGLGFIFGRKTA